MYRRGLLLSLSGVSWVIGARDDTNFLDWFRSELNETQDEPLVFDRPIPSYLTGTFVQTGPARFSYGDMQFTHMMDGYSKSNKVQFSKDGTATYTTKFLVSKFMNESIKKNEIARGMFVGNIIPDPHWGPTAAMAANDNNYIKMQRIGDRNMLLSDTMIATEVQEDCTSFEQNIRSEKMSLFVPGSAWDDSIEPRGDICNLGTMAHGDVDSLTGVFTGAMGCLGVGGNYHMVFTIDPAEPTTRKLVGKADLRPSRGPSYMHSFASTPNYIVLIAEPLYMDIEQILLGRSLGEGGLKTNDDDTLFQIVDRKTGSVRTLEAPGFIFGHVLNSWEEGTDIVIDLTWYAANNMTTLGWMNRWFLEYMSDTSIRENWPHSKIMRYRLKADGQVEQKVLFANEHGENDFETPKINEKFRGHPYCISYMMQFHSYRYDVDHQAKKAGPFGAVGLAKRNLCTGERLGWYESNTYPSEVEFVPNPSGAAEDDGVLLGIVFDGHTNSSFFQIMDAQTMQPVARASLPIKAPFLIHSSYFSEKSSSEFEILV